MCPSGGSEDGSPLAFATCFARKFDICAAVARLRARVCLMLRTDPSIAHVAASAFITPTSKHASRNPRQAVGERVMLVWPPPSCRTVMLCTSATREHGRQSKGISDYARSAAFHLNGAVDEDACGLEGIIVRTLSAGLGSRRLWCSVLEVFLIALELVAFTSISMSATWVFLPHVRRRIPLIRLKFARPVCLRPTLTHVCLKLGS